MSSISKSYYDDDFKGVPMPESEFNRLSDIASDVIYDVCIHKPTEQDLVSDDYKKAVAYQIELLHEQGGVDAIIGFSEASQSAGSESLGGYSVSGGSGQTLPSIGGIPVSPMALMLLRRLGLMQRCVYVKR